MPSGTMKSSRLRVLVVGDWDAGGGVLSVVRDLAQELAGEVEFYAFFFNGPSGKSPWADFCRKLFYNSQISLTELLVRENFDAAHLIDTACPPPYDVNRWLRRARFAGGVLCNFHVCDAVVRRDQIAHGLVACSEVAAEFTK